MEADMIQGCIAGNRIMQKKLYERYAPAMYVVCLRYAGNRQDAEEILQEAFVRVFTCLWQYQHKGSFEAWIRKIIINCALQKYRKEVKNKLCYPQNLNRYDERSDAEVIWEHLEAEEIIRLIHKLPPMCRLVFNLFVFDDLKHREIAQMLHISEGTSKSNLHDARMILQQKLCEQNSFMPLNANP